MHSSDDVPAWTVQAKRWDGGYIRQCHAFVTYIFGGGILMTDFINSHAFKAANLPFSQAVRVGDTVYLSGCIGNVAGGMELVPGGIEAESRQMMQNIARVLEEAGLGFEHIVKCVVYLADMAEWSAFNKVYVPYFEAGRLPARTAIGAHQLILNARVEMECVAARP
jgi:reactive intermediate/imine deaminase